MKDSEKYVNEKLQNGAKWVDLNVVLNEPTVEARKIKLDGVLYKVNFADESREELARVRTIKEYRALQEQRVELNQRDIDKAWYYITVIEEHID